MGLFFRIYGGIQQGDSLSELTHNWQFSCLKSAWGVVANHEEIFGVFAKRDLRPFLHFFALQFPWNTCGIKKRVQLFQIENDRNSASFQEVVQKFFPTLRFEGVFFS